MKVQIWNYTCVSILFTLAPLKVSNIVPAVRTLSGELILSSLCKCVQITTPSLINSTAVTKIPESNGFLLQFNFPEDQPDSLPPLLWPLLLCKSGPAKVIRNIIHSSSSVLSYFWFVCWYKCWIISHIVRIVISTQETVKKFKFKFKFVYCEPT